MLPELASHQILLRLLEGIGVSVRDFRIQEGQLFRDTTRQPDAREGTKAFFERRQPNWTGQLSDLPPWPEITVP